MPAKKRFVRGHIYKLTKLVDGNNQLLWDGTTPEEERPYMVVEFVRSYGVIMYVFHILAYFNRNPRVQHKFGITRNTLERAWIVEEISPEELPLYFGPSVTPYFETAIKRVNGGLKRKVRGRPKPCGSKRL